MPSLFRYLFAPILASALICGISGCSDDPADGVPEAEILGAVPETETAETEPDAPETAEVTATDRGPVAVYKLTPENSTIGFIGSKVTGSHEGGFTGFEGYIAIEGGTHEHAAVDVQIIMESTFTDNEQLTSHLKTGDFFDTEKYPYSRFRANKITQAKGDDYDVIGSLDLHGIENRIKIPAEIEVTDEKVTVNAEFSIDRSQFEIIYKGAADDLVRERVVINLALNAERIPDPAVAKQVLADKKWKLETQ